MAKKRFYRTLWGQVLVAVLLAIVLGHFKPDTGVAMKPLGDAFIRAISMIIAVVIFCTIIPATVVDAFARGSILSVVLVSVLFVWHCRRWAKKANRSLT